MTTNPTALLEAGVLIGIALCLGVQVVVAVGREAARMMRANRQNRGR